jgi:uncharacterized membrane protein
MKSIFATSLALMGVSAATTETGCVCKATSEVIFTKNGASTGGGFSHQVCV